MPAAHLKKPPFPAESHLEDGMLLQTRWGYKFLWLPVKSQGGQWLWLRQAIFREHRVSTAAYEYVDKYYYTDTEALEYSITSS